ncbi:glycosyltransferase [Paenalcaligenes sp. Me131]|uniref:glycosyltransferase n=1 Tax=Paenalcaligenes sp. Me131 TaxID=3392636 RepID=UPI003D2A92B7
MKVVLFSAASSIHTIRWANGLNAAGHEVHVISQHQSNDPFDDGVKVYSFPNRGVLGYFTMVPKAKRILSKVKPDIVNAHYASGYATTARLVGYHPWVLSVWGSDIYDFPYISFLHRYLVRKNLLAADAIASTSYCMAKQTKRIAPEIAEISVTPFGVDMSAYASIPLTGNTNASPLVIGTVKTMAKKYGIDTLIRAFALLHRDLLSSHPELVQTLRLRLVGGGPQKEELALLVDQLQLTKQVDFIGRVPHANVPSELEKMDIYVALSRLDSESFGVAIIEAGAAGRPVVVSDVGGLPEVTINNETGLVVPREDEKTAAEALKTLVLNPELRQKMGIKAKNHVQENYSWHVCLESMEKTYQNTIEKYSEQ